MVEAPGAPPHQAVVAAHEALAAKDLCGHSGALHEAPGRRRVRVRAGLHPAAAELAAAQQARAFEWCAGPGFIGFSLLGNGFCQTLCLADINPAAVEAARRTIQANRLGDRVSVYLSDNLSDIPATERWDLVVSNPPHFVDTFIGDLRAHDPDWRIHRGFFSTVEPHLNPGAVMVLQENNRGSTAEMFRTMIEAAGLSVIFVHGCAPQRTDRDQFYYIGIMRRGDAPPDWARRLMGTGG
jgi:predicted RNA methylase